MDLYSDFKTLSARETEDRDFRILVRDTGSPVSIIAPHGGRIEPGTCVIADMIAGNRYGYYCFEGLKPLNNSSLHITSHRFDEPRALRLARLSAIVVTIHACKDKTDIVYTGGLHRTLADLIRQNLIRMGYAAKPHGKYSGTHPGNICNKGKLKKGVQLEISRSIRDNKKKSLAIAFAVRQSLEHFLK